MERKLAVRKGLTQARDLIISEDRCDVLVASLLKLRDELRALYKDNRSAFGADDVLFLQRLSGLLSAAESFEELRRQVAQVKTRDDYEELRGSLVALLTDLAGTKIALQVNREIAKLDRRAKTYRVEDSRAVQNALGPSPLAKLFREAPRCTCGNWMTLREGERRYFWGCSTFPSCRHVRNLTRAQLESVDT